MPSGRIWRTLFERMAHCMIMVCVKRRSSEDFSEILRGFIADNKVIFKLNGEKLPITVDRNKIREQQVKDVGKIWRTLFERMAYCMIMVCVKRRIAEDFSKILGDFIANDKVEIELNDEKLPITVDRNKTREQQVKDCDFDFSSLAINQENFPIEREIDGRLSFKPDFYCSLVIEEKLSKLVNQGERTADLSELLAFGAKYPDELKGLLIICLGSTCRDSDGNLCVPCIDGRSSKRRLCLIKFKEKWPAGCLFLIVPK